VGAGICFGGKRGGMGREWETGEDNVDSWEMAMAAVVIDATRGLRSTSNGATEADP